MNAAQNDRRAELAEIEEARLRYINAADVVPPTPGPDESLSAVVEIEPPPAATNVSDMLPAVRQIAEGLADHAAAGERAKKLVRAMERMSGELDLGILLLRQPAEEELRFRLRYAALATEAFSRMRKSKMRFIDPRIFVGAAFRSGLAKDDAVELAHRLAYAAARLNLLEHGLELASIMARVARDAGTPECSAKLAAFLEEARRG